MHQIKSVPQSASKEFEAEEPSSNLNFFSSRINQGDSLLWIGVISESIATDLSAKLGSQGRLIVNSGYRKIRGLPNLHYLESRTEVNQLDLGSVHLGVIYEGLEYHPNPMSLLNEVSVLLKPQGRLLVVEHDNHLLNHYPLAKHLEQQLFDIARDLHSRKLWDPQIGRKLFGLMSEAGFRELKATSLPAEIITGAEQDSDLESWERWFHLLKKWKNEGLWPCAFDLDQFRNDFLIFFDNPERFSYNQRIAIEGIPSNSCF